METAECSKALLRREAILEPRQTSSPSPACVVSGPPPLILHWEGEDGERPLLLLLLLLFDSPGEAEATGRQEEGVPCKAAPWWGPPTKPASPLDTFSIKLCTSLSWIQEVAEELG